MTTRTYAMQFDVCGPLPAGITVLEASAGTGKTFTIAALAARYVAEGTPLHRLLLVTFTRMATGELRDRVRERLTSTERALARVLAGADEHLGDEVVALLAAGSRAQVSLRRGRLERALADFDAATIATTHGFCLEVLGELGTIGDLEPDIAFVEDIGDLLDEVVDDLYVRRFHRHDEPLLDRDEAMKIARIAVDNPTVPVQPRGAAPESTAAMRRRLALAVREELERRKRRLAIMTYDDLLTRLAGTLGGSNGAEAAARLHDRYRLVLVDEFQDTDPVQWEILRRGFAGAGVTLVLIADPKQAIYAFRGADVYAYLDAAEAADARATLTVNRRSDQGLIDAYDALFAGARLGHPGIVYRQVQAAPGNRASRLLGAPVDAPLRVRVLNRDEPTIRRTPGRFVTKPSAHQHIARDLAADLVALLASGAQLEVRDARGTTVGRDPLRPGHVAVLVRTHRTAAIVRDALDAARIPAVINGAGSVFATGAARDWLRLLEAVEQPTSSTRAHAAALTPFIGWSGERVAGAGEADSEQLHKRLHQWARVLRGKGVAALSEAITIAEGLPARVLSELEGERRMTDLRHVGQLLHGAAIREQLGTTALTSWLRRRIAAADRESADEEQSRRLESDAEAVQVLTIHRSKGLEFPIVYCPYLWEPGYIARNPEPIFFHDPEAHNRRTIDVGLDGPEFARHQRQYCDEQRGEELRLAYVALTRAKHQAVIWWAPSFDSHNSPLGRLLFARDEQGNVAAYGTVKPIDAAIVERLEELSGEAPGCLSVERSTLGLPTSWQGLPAEPVELGVAPFERRLDLRWRRTSYSDIAAAAYDPRVASEPGEEVIVDEPSSPPVAVVAPFEPVQPGSALSLATMPVGVEVGTFVHRVLQRTDFAAVDLEAELAQRVEDVRAWRPVEIGEARPVLAGLRAAIETPLGPLLDDFRLRELSRADRLDELEFELPLVGGDRPRGRALATRAIGGLLREHLPSDDPLAGYAARLDDPLLRQELRGYLTGSIDLVLRLPQPGGVPRFAIVDYKTNWLGPPGEELASGHYRPAALTAEMLHSHYGLQALLYTVALHRYLRWRLPAYDAGRSLAGVLYLFLRGMTGPDTPLADGMRHGVFAWRPPSALVEGLSDLVDEGGAG
jgi:exodeoxyribonuclease V beta subunit